MTTTLLQYVARFDNGGEIVGFRWGGWLLLIEESAVVLAVCRIPIFTCCAKAASDWLYLRMCWRGTSLSTIFHIVFVPIFFFEQSVVAGVEGVAFRPKG